MKRKSRKTDTYAINSNITYWDWINENCQNNEDGDFIEPVKANPDTISEEDGLVWPKFDHEATENKVKTVRAIFSVLSSKEQKLCKLLMDNRTYREIASILGTHHVKVVRMIKKLRKKFEILYQNQ